ncbi:hypothetical protein CLOSTASPAR_01488 [[Clostridium] asparagiforme DSM 15981]|uniref:Uncharacterized protein n=1 Tax=[Clostridium] asparagiforme DSM 15981 TaxID=518636 RepID=C0CWW7_9FIRM|nr:hypothetical protein CLOSTASPAR_01488 [[Clostridium] asparagiforme DSM 15981]
MSKVPQISIHEAFADLDGRYAIWMTGWLISIHEAFADLDTFALQVAVALEYFNPRGLRRPRLSAAMSLLAVKNFNPRGLRRPRPLWAAIQIWCYKFQSTRPSQTSTFSDVPATSALMISIHEAFADLD